jgi:hypothetical protein
MNWILAGEISGGIIAGLWIVAYGVAGIRYLRFGPDVLEVINEAFYVKYAAQAAAEQWLHRFLVVFDIACNVAARGQEDETISSRSWRASLEGKLWGRVLNKWLNLLQPQHGPKAMVGDLYRALNRVALNKKILGLT